jgi:hypothetical protein
MSGTDRQVVRSYQRIFTPDRRIYQVEGHRIPVPGGVPLAWLGYFVATLLSVLLLATRSLSLGMLLALIAAGGGRAVGGRGGALLLGVSVLVGSQVLGVMLSVIDWPLRLVILPAGLATLATQATPDGRPMHRYVRSWLALRLRPARRSLGRGLPHAGARRQTAAGVWAAPDHHGARLRRGRVVGPATVKFREPVLVSDGRFRGSMRRLARPAHPELPGAVSALELAHGERLEVRP